MGVPPADGDGAPGCNPFKGNRGTGTCMETDINIICCREGLVCEP